MNELSKEQIEGAIDLCEVLLERSHCIYSRFPVASVLITQDDQMISGCNVENASFGLTICAERTAAVKAVSEGYKKFKACFVLTEMNKTTAPCGACRQFLAEFGISMDIYLVSRDRSYSKHKLEDILPLAFLPSDLDK